MVVLGSKLGGPVFYASPYLGFTVHTSIVYACAIHYATNYQTCKVGFAQVQRNLNLKLKFECVLYRRGSRDEALNFWFWMR